MIKRVVCMVLVFLFLNLTLTTIFPDYTFAESREEELKREEEAWKSWRVLTGIAALIFLIWVLSSPKSGLSNNSINKDTKLAIKDSKRNSRIKIAMGLAEDEYLTDFQHRSIPGSKSEWYSPEIRMSITW